MKKINKISIEKNYSKNLFFIKCFNKIPLPLIICDVIYNLQEKKKEYVISDINKSFIKTFNLNNSELIGKDVKEIKNKILKNVELIKFVIDKNLTCFAVFDCKKIRKNDKNFEKLRLYEILRNVNKILFDSKNRDILIKRISREINKLDFVDFFYIYLNKD
ncbi:MAG: hypothetical protein N3D74_06730, partial [Caldisericia bacterium]|nr:hypothetical protein [Caldisericia bacterium]